MLYGPLVRPVVITGKIISDAALRVIVACLVPAVHRVAKDRRARLVDKVVDDMLWLRTAKQIKEVVGNPTRLRQEMLADCLNFQHPIGTPRSVGVAPAIGTPKTVAVFDTFGIDRRIDMKRKVLAQRVGHRLVGEQKVDEPCDHPGTDNMTRTLPTDHYDIPLGLWRRGVRDA